MKKIMLAFFIFSIVALVLFAVAVHIFNYSTVLSNACIALSAGNAFLALYNFFS